MIKYRVAWMCLVVCLVPEMRFAHVDDPKVQDQQSAFVGPAWFAGSAVEVGVSFPSSNISLKSWLPIAEFGPNIVRANDCWGYVSPSGREYAIIGLSHGTGFVDITTPNSAEIVAVLDGPTSTWRDIKVFGTHAYAVSEGGGGVQVFDLSDIDSGIVTLANTITGDGTDKTHNVAINEASGFLYRCGGSSNGLRVYSLADPVNPAYVEAWTDRYVHDAQVVSYTSGPNAGREIAFCFGGFNGGHVETGVSIVDVTDKNNMFLITHFEYPNGSYCHQGWLSPDRRYLYLNDELDERNQGTDTTTIIVDVDDLSAPFLVGSFGPGTSSIDHNLYMNGDFIYEANYRGGLRVFDASVPAAPVEVGYFDTYPDNDNSSFNGLWSCYPFFPSGTIIGSDIEKGLFVWRQQTAPPEYDINGDGLVDSGDMYLVLNKWQCVDSCPADFNQNGRLEILDFAILLNNTCP